MEHTTFRGKENTDDERNQPTFRKANCRAPMACLLGGGGVLEVTFHNSTEKRS